MIKTSLNSIPNSLTEEYHDKCWVLVVFVHLFYYLQSLNNTCPSCDLAQRITDAAKQHAPPHFVTVYGGLQANGGSEVISKKNFLTLVGDTYGRLGSEFVPVRAPELARLAKEALHQPPAQ